MRVVIQRVLKSIVKSKEKVISQIGTGLVLFVGVEIEDNERRRLVDRENCKSTHH